MISFYLRLKGVRLNLAELFEIEVKRVSVGSALLRTALGAFHHAAREMREHGTFDFSDKAVRYRDISAAILPFYKT